MSHIHISLTQSDYCCYRNKDQNKNQQTTTQEKKSSRKHQIQEVVPKLASLDKAPF